MKNGFKRLKNVLRQNSSEVHKFEAKQLLLLLHVEEDVKAQIQTWIMIASIQGNPVLASLQASSSLSSSFQGIYNIF